MSLVQAEMIKQCKGDTKLDLEGPFLNGVIKGYFLALNLTPEHLTLTILSFVGILSSVPSSPTWW